MVVGAERKDMRWLQIMGREEESGDGQTKKRKRKRKTGTFIYFILHLHDAPTPAMQACMQEFLFLANSNDDVEQTKQQRRGSMLPCTAGYC